MMSSVGIPIDFDSSLEGFPSHDQGFNRGVE